MNRQDFLRREAALLRRRADTARALLQWDTAAAYERRSKAADAKADELDTDAHDQQYPIF